MPKRILGRILRVIRSYQSIIDQSNQSNHRHADARSIRFSIHTKNMYSVIWPWIIVFGHPISPLRARKCTPSTLTIWLELFVYSFRQVAIFTSFLSTFTDPGDCQEHIYLMNFIPLPSRNPDSFLFSCLSCLLLLFCLQTLVGLFARVYLEVSGHMDLYSFRI